MQQHPSPLHSLLHNNPLQHLLFMFPNSINCIHRLSLTWLGMAWLDLTWLNVVSRFVIYRINNVATCCLFYLLSLLLSRLFHLLLRQKCCWEGCVNYTIGEWVSITFRKCFSLAVFVADPCQVVTSFASSQSALEEMAAVSSGKVVSSDEQRK